MNLNITYDTSANNAPSGFFSAINYVIQYFDSLFTDNIAVNINVGWGTINGQSLSSGALGESLTFLTSSNYTAIKNALTSDAKSADDKTAIGTLPASNPTGGGSYYVSTAEAKALGLLGPSASLDGYCGFSSTVSWTFDPNNRAVPGRYDFIGTFEHEITEIMGRTTFNGDPFNGTAHAYEPLDLFHYSGPNSRTFSGTVSGYFSIDGGNTNLGNFNTNPNGDFSDWAASVGNDSFLAFSSSGVMNSMTTNDIREMDVLGYDMTTPTLVSNVLGVGDFNADHTSDILFSGSNVNIWEMNGTQSLAKVTGPQVPANWILSGIGDFNGDGAADILWRQPDGTVNLWEMNEAQVIGTGSWQGVGLQWQVQAVGDINGDGKSDIVWRDSVDGTVALWTMNGTQISATQAFAHIGLQWQIQGMGDFNGDGMKDLLWRDSTDGTVALWELNGIQIIDTAAFAKVGFQWHVIGIGDVNGDGKSDILWEDRTDGTVAIWQMNGPQVVGAAAVGRIGSNWRVAGVGDFNNDGKSDILWQDTTTSSLQEWQMNGSQISASQTVAGTQGIALASPDQSQSFGIAGDVSRNPSIVLSKS